MNIKWLIHPYEETLADGATESPGVERPDPYAAKRAAALEYLGINHVLHPLYATVEHPRHNVSREARGDTQVSL